MKALIALTVISTLSIGFAGCKSTQKTDCCAGTSTTCCAKKSIPERIGHDAASVAEQAGDAVVGTLDAVGGAIDKAVGGDGDKN
tara:strand:- start:609 stop:860 length:252 start_codon:yes stop_codon:yes gene_type:complete